MCAASLTSPPIIRTPDQRLRVFISSTLQELAEERAAARAAVERLRLVPVLFELGARPHPPRDLYRAYLEQSDIFIGVYWQKYGWVAPGETISGLEDEYRLSGARPKLIYIKTPAPEREPRLKELLDQIRNDDRASYKSFATAAELREFIENDLAVLLTERFAAQAGESHLPEARHSNLPTPPTALIGREKEVALVRDGLLRGDAKPVTLTGPGGSGKTRLAIEVAAGLIGQFPDGVYFVPLAPIDDPDLVAPAIAHALDVRETPGGSSLLDSLKDYLRHKHMLLILDNFEHVLSAARLISELIAACSRLSVLVTSRAPLRLRGERDVPVPPLSLPGRGQVSDMEGVSQYAAVELFIRRALDVNPSFSVTNASAPAIAEICCRLDGLPLAIELAAARTKILSPQALLARLEKRLDVLRGGLRDLPARQQTLRDTIAWSYDLLGDKARVLFRRLSIFTGGWTLDAAEEVCNATGDLDVDVLDEMQALVDYNLLTVADVQGEVRFGMLETIREFARERLVESGEERLLGWCHAMYCLRLAEEFDAHLPTPDRQQWIERLETELDNLRAALDWSRSPQGDVEIGLGIAGLARWFWFRSGHISEGRNWLESLLAISLDPDVSPSLEVCLGNALAGSGGLAWSQGDTELARVRLEHAAAIFRRTGDANRLGQTITFQGLLALGWGDVASARERLEESLHLLRSAGNRWAEALALNNLGDVMTMSGDLDAAQSLYSQSLAGFQTMSDSWGMGLALNSLAGVAWFLGNHDAARQMYAQSVSLARQSRDRWILVRPLIGLLDALWHQGDFAQAKALAIETLTLCRELGAMTALLLALGGAASLLTACERPDIAARLFGAGDALSDKMGFVSYAIDRIRLDRNLELTRSRLGEAAFQAARAAGQAMMPNQAVDYALDEVGRV